MCKGSSSSFFRWSGLCIPHYPCYRVTVIQLASWQLITAHKHSHVSTNQRDPELPKWCQWSILSVARRRGWEIPVSTERWFDVKKKKSPRLKKKHLIVECSPRTSTLVWYYKWVSGPAGPGLSSGSWMVLCPFLVHCSWRFTRIWDSMVWCRLHRLIKVLQLKNFCLFAKMVHGILFWFLIFLKLQISVPVLEGIKQLWLWWSQRCLHKSPLVRSLTMFMNISEIKIEQWCAHLQKLCASPSCLCFHGQVMSFFSP